MPRPALTDHVTERLKALPTRPGCYIYRDEQQNVLYVGKAINLRNRVRSYFRKSANHTARIERLVFRVRDIEWIVVDSEVEALVLECNLIKEHRPPFNVRMRDDKSYPFIAITKEKFPRVLFTRNPRKGWGEAFGPYTSAWAVRETLQILHKAFPLIPCGKSWSGQPEQRPCLYYHMQQCLAPCAGMVTQQEYRQVIAKVRSFLQGKDLQIIDELKAEMEQCAEDLNFERAATLRDQIQKMEHIRERQKVLSEDGEDRDVVAVVKDDRGAAVQMLYIRGGRLIGQRQFMLDGSKDSSPTEAVQEFVKQYYTDAPEIPREVLLPVEIEERQIVQQWLRQRRGGAVSVDVPNGGEGLRLVELAMDNAEQALRTFAMELEEKEAWAEQALSQLAEALELPTLPARIEGYDISNIQGTSPVGSMVVTENGEPSKQEYRRFQIKWHPESPNDFAMMNEVILRRLRRYLDEDPKFLKLPDLIMIDGGKGQLGAALDARDKLEIQVPMVGLAKRMELIYVPVQNEDGTYAFKEIELPLTSPGLLLLRRLRDEAHRFALTFHRKVRDKRMHGSLLDEIPGIGPKRRRMLLRTFGSVEGIRRATVEEIAAVPTLTRTQAEQIRMFLDGELA